MELQPSQQSQDENASRAQYPEATIVVAATQDMGMSFATHLPWPKLQREHGWFETITTHTNSTKGSGNSSNMVMNAVIMGYNTWDDIPTKLFPDRINVVITRTPSKVWARLFEDKRKGLIHVATSIEEAVKGLQRAYAPRIDGVRNGRISLGRIFVIGGAELCKTAIEIPWVCRLFLTRISAGMQCDTFFPMGLDGNGNEVWERQSDDRVRSWAGAEAPIGRQQEKGIEWEMYMFERRAS